MAKQMVKERQDITGLNCIKGATRKVIVDDKGIEDSWKEYMEKLMNEENEWDHKISAFPPSASIHALLARTSYAKFLLL